MAQFIVVHCPHCKTGLKIGTNRPGQLKCKCPKCETQFEVTVRAPNTATHSKAPPTGLNPQEQSPQGEQLTKTKLETPVQAQESPPPEKVLKTKLETPGPGKVQKSPPARNESSPEASNTARPPVPRRSRTRIRARWLLASASLIAILGIMSICVVGVVRFWPSPQPTPAEFPTTLKPGQLSREEFDARAKIIPFEKVGIPKRLYEIEMVRIKGKATVFDPFNESDFFITWQSLKRVKYDEVSENVMLIGNHGFFVRNQMPETLKDERLKYYQNFNYSVVLSYLIVLTEQGSDVSTSGKMEDVPIDETKKKCSTAIVKRSGRPEMKLFFDENKFLVKAEFTGTCLDANDKPLPNTFVEFFFYDHKPTGDVHHWKRLEQRRNGRKYAEIVVKEVEFFDTVDDKYFRFIDPALQAKVDDLMDVSKAREIKKVIFGINPAASDFSNLVSGFNNNQNKPELRLQFQAALLDYIDLLGKRKVALLDKAEDVDALVTLLKTDCPVELQSFATEEMLRLDPNRLNSEFQHTLSDLPREVGR